MDSSIKYLYGVTEDMLVKMNNFMFSMNYVILDIEEDDEVFFILGNLFFPTYESS